MEVEKNKLQPSCSSNGIPHYAWNGEKAKNATGLVTALGAAYSQIQQHSQNKCRMHGSNRPQEANALVNQYHPIDWLSLNWPLASLAITLINKTMWITFIIILMGNTTMTLLGKITKSLLLWVADVPKLSIFCPTFVFGYQMKTDV